MTCAFHQHHIEFCLILSCFFCSIDGCIDFNSVTPGNPDVYNIERVIVRSGEGVEHNPIEALTIGKIATIIATGANRIPMYRYNHNHN